MLFSIPHIGLSDGLERNGDENSVFEPLQFDGTESRVDRMGANLTGQLN